MWVAIGTNFAQVLGELHLQADSEHEARFHTYRPRYPEAVPSRIYQALLGCGAKLQWGAIRKLANIGEHERHRAEHALRDLVKWQHVAREGTRRKYRYWAISRSD